MVGFGSVPELPVGDFLDGGSTGTRFADGVIDPEEMVLALGRLRQIVQEVNRDVLDGEALSRCRPGGPGAQRDTAVPAIP